jgi:uncharacterized protein (TIGR04222 family)
MTDGASPSSGKGMSGLGYEDFAYLRGGPQASVNATLAAMNAKGLVDAWGTGMVMSNKDLSPALQTPTEHAVWSALYEGTRPRTLAARPPMRRALNSTRVELIHAGALRPGWLWGVQHLLGLALVALAAVDVIDGWGFALAGVAVVAGIAVWFIPRRSVAGQRALVAARRKHPMPTLDNKAKPPAETVGMAVALYGNAALRSLVDRFATNGGLYDRRTFNDELGDASAPPSNPASKGY